MRIVEEPYEYIYSSAKAYCEQKSLLEIDFYNGLLKTNIKKHPRYYCRSNEEEEGCRKIVQFENIKKMKKKPFWFICWIISILYALAIISMPIFYIYFTNDFESKKQLGEFIREYATQGLFRFGGLISFVFWIYSIIVWNKRRDNVFNLLLLVFLNVIYAPIYYIRVIRNISNKPTLFGITGPELKGRRFAIFKKYS